MPTPDPSAVAAMTAQMAAYVLDQHRAVTLAELRMNIRGFCGDRSLMLGDIVVLWAGLSSTAAHALIDLVAPTSDFEAVPWNVGDYAKHGALLALPITLEWPLFGQQRRGAFAWLPTAVCLRAAAVGDPRLLSPSVSMFGTAFVDWKEFGSGLVDPGVDSIRAWNPSEWRH